MKIFDLLHRIDKHLDEHPEWLENCQKLFLIFNNQDHPYLAVLKQIEMDGEIEQMGFSKHDQVFGVHVYETYAFSKVSAEDHIAVMYFSKDKSEFDQYGKPNKDMYLAKLHITNPKHSKKELGAAMLKVLDLCAINLKKNKITAYMYPHDYLLGKLKTLKRFYRANGFAVHEQTALAKRFTTKTKQATKLPFMSIPTKKRDYVVLFPEHHIISSGYKEKGVSICSPEQ